MHLPRVGRQFAPPAARLRPSTVRPTLGGTGRWGTALHGDSWGAGEDMDNSHQAQTRRAVSAAVIGNVLEWYDFAVYGYVATIIAKNFFPAGNESAALLATFAAFGIGFLARPLGGIVI